MGMSINTNPGAILAAVAATRASAMMDEAMTRLSTGKRINSAKDDPAALQVAVRMEGEINGLSAALKNANKYQSALDMIGKNNRKYKVCYDHYYHTNLDCLNN